MRAPHLASIAAAWLVAASPVEARKSPGGREMKCIDGKHTCNIILPPAYKTDKNRRFPALFTSTAPVNPSFFQMESWAARNQVILISINDTQHNQERTTWAAAHRAVMETVEEKVRIHPCLRFSMGLHAGGVASGMYLINLFPDKFAGMCALGHHGLDQGKKLPKHMPVAFVHGKNDEVHKVGLVEGVVKRMKARGQPVRLHIGEWGCEPGPLEQRERFMDWMFERMRLTHPNLPEADREAAKAELRERVAALGTNASPGRCVAEAEAIFQLPGVDRLVDMKALRAAWFRGKHDLASGQTDVAIKHEMLSELAEHGRTRLCNSKSRRRLAQELRKLRQNSPAREEYAARRMYRQVQFMEGKIGKSKMRMTQTARAYSILARRHPDTVAGKKAAADAQRLAEKLSAGKR